MTTHNQGGVPSRIRRPSRTRRPRLADFDYAGRYAYHITIVTRGRGPLLRGTTAAHVVDALHVISECTSFDVLAYVVMPDHVHILVLGTSDDANLIRFVQRFKQKAAHDASAGRGGLWQQSFHDHVVRGDEDLRTIAQYITGNPRRGGLAADDAEWPFVGGTMVASGEERRR